MSELSVINEVNRMSEIKEYKFTTKDGKPLTVTGELARDLAIYFDMATLGNKATFEIAHRIRNIMDTPAETLKEKYAVDSGSKFIDKYLGLAKGTISNYKKVADMFFEKTSSNVRDAVFEVYNFAQLQELSVYIVKYMDKKHSEFDEAYKALLECVTADYPFTMSASKIRSAIRKEFEAVDEKKIVDENAGNETETAGNETETVGNETENAGNVPTFTNETAFTILNRCKSARMTFDENGEYVGDDIVNHFRDTLDFIIKILENK